MTASALAFRSFILLTGTPSAFAPLVINVIIIMFGQEHQDVAATHGPRFAWDYERALLHFGKAQEVSLALFGQSHPDVADTKYNMALLHKKLSERDLARQLFLDCEAIYAEVYGPDHSKKKGAEQQAPCCE